MIIHNVQLHIARRNDYVSRYVLKRKIVMINDITLAYDTKVSVKNIIYVQFNQVVSIVCECYGL